MSAMTLTGNEVYSYITSGAKNLIQYEQYLNKINVFPVADGDTGTNLAFTMKSIIRNSVRSDSVEETLASISKSALDSSYGNSGTIVAGYLNGIFIRTKGKQTLSSNEFIEILSTAVADAYGAITVPKEGTILTVMREWGEYIVAHYPHTPSLKELFKASIEHAKITLENTKNILKELREANTVDAGGKGFVYFIEGIYEFMVSGIVGTKEVSKEFETLDIHVDQDIEFRYCTEFIFEPNKGFVKKELENHLMSQGDSVIINGYEDYVKIHLHTNDPEQSALYMRGQGKITNTKIDDMLIQYEIANHRKHAIGIITDSIADIPEEILLEEQITVIPIQMIIDGATYIDRVTLTSDNTYELIESAKVYPSSSQPNDSYILKTLEYLDQHFDEIIGIFISSKMSGTFEKVSRIVKENQMEHIHLIDSKLNSGGEGLIVREAYESIKAGLGIKTILERLEKRVAETKIFVKIPDLSYATKSGRVPKAVGKIADLFKLKVIISIDETGEGIVTKNFSLKKAVKKATGGEGIKEYMIMHSSAPEKAKDVARSMTELLGKEPIYIENVSAVIAAFIGKNAVGIAYTKEV